MFHRRGVLPVFVLIFLVLAGGVLGVVRGSSPPASPPATAADAVLGSLAAVVAAFDAGETQVLCHPFLC
jgi:hypothetical protein